MEGGQERRLSYFALDSATDIFHAKLYDHQEALSYLREQRKLEDSTIDHFKLGYAPNERNLLKNRLNIQEGVSQRLLHRIGLLTISEKPDSSNEETGHECYDFFRDRIMIPFFENRRFDEETKLRAIGFSGRILQPNQKKAKYINSRTNDNPVYNKGEYLFNWDEASKSAREINRLVIFEAPISSITAWQQNHPYTTAICGSALTQDHLEKIRKRLPDAEIILFPDGDDSGLEAAERSLAAFLKYRLKVCYYKGDKDPDDLMRSGLDLSDLLNATEGGFDFLLSRKSKKLNESTKGSPSLEGRIKLLQELKTSIATLDGEQRGIYLDSLSTKLGIALGSLNDFFQPKAGKDYDSKRDSERKFVQLLIESCINPDTLRYFLPLIEGDVFSPATTTIMRYLSNGGGREVLLRLDEDRLGATGQQALFKTKPWTEIINSVVALGSKEGKVLDPEFLEDFLNQTNKPSKSTHHRRVTLEEIEFAAVNVLKFSFGETVLNAFFNRTRSLESLLYLLNSLKKEGKKSEHEKQ